LVEVGGIERLTGDLEKMAIDPIAVVACDVGDTELFEGSEPYSHTTADVDDGLGVEKVLADPGDKIG
jgi:hypothetical protein